MTHRVELASLLRLGRLRYGQRFFNNGPAFQELHSTLELEILLRRWRTRAAFGL